MTGFMEPYDVIFTQEGLATLSILPLQIQPDKSNGSIRHHLPVGSYMLSVAYDGPEMLELRKNVAETIATIPAGKKGETRTAFVPRVAVTAADETFCLVSTPAQSQADPDAKGVLSVYPNELYDPDGGGGGTDPDPVDPDPEEPDPELTEVEAPAPSWTDNSDGGGSWTTPVVEGVKYNPASGTATPGQTVTVTATALDGYVLLGATEWTHTFSEEPEDPDPGEGDPPYSFTIREDTAPVNDRKQIYALTAEQWAALSYLREPIRVMGVPYADKLRILNVALRSDVAEIIGVTSVTNFELVETGVTRLGSIYTMYARNKTTAYKSFESDIGSVITEISEKGVLI